MSVLVFPKTDTQVPTARGVSVLRRDKLLHAWIFNEGDQPHDLVTGERGARINGDVYRTEKEGPALVHPATTDRSTLLADSQDTIHGVPTGQITILLGYRKRDAVARNSSAFSINSDAPVSQRCLALLPFGAPSDVFWDFGGATAGTSRISFAWVEDDRFHVWAFTAGPRGMEIWEDGFIRASQTGHVTRTTTANAFILGGNIAGVSSDLANTRFLFMWDEMLTKADIYNLSRDLSRLFPRPRRLWQAVPAISLISEGRMPVEWKGEVTRVAEGRMPVEWRGEVTLVNQAPLPVEWSATLVAEALIPVEWTGEITLVAEARMPVEFSTAILAEVSLPIESRGRDPFNVQHRWNVFVRLDVPIIHEWNLLLETITGSVLQHSWNVRKLLVAVGHIWRVLPGDIAPGGDISPAAGGLFSEDIHQPTSERSLTP